MPTTTQDELGYFAPVEDVSDMEQDEIPHPIKQIQDDLMDMADLQVVSKIPPPPQTKNVNLGYKELFTPSIHYIEADEITLLAKTHWLDQSRADPNIVETIWDTFFTQKINAIGI